MKNIKPEEVIKIVCNHYSTEVKDVGKDRSLAYRKPRQIAQMLMRKYCKIRYEADDYKTGYFIMPYHIIGRYMTQEGAKPFNHATIINSITKIENQLDYDKSFRFEIENIEKTIFRKMNESNINFLKEEIDNAKEFIKKREQEILKLI